MKITINIIFTLVFSFTIGTVSYAQKKGKPEKVKLERADELEGGKVKGERVNKFKGNVVFSQGGTLLYCDSAYQYQKKSDRNTIDAFGNVRIQQGDSVTLTGDKLHYNGDTRTAVMTGKTVFLRDKNMTLTTKYLEYDLNSKLAHYIYGGTIQDQQTTLTSEFGYYSTDTKLFRFKKNVRVVNPSKNYSLSSDTLHYNSNTKIATFKGPSRIESKDGVVIANEGEYNTVTGESNFKAKGGKAEVQTGTYTLTGDKIYYDEKRKVGIVQKNVRLISEKDKIIIEGDMANYWGDKGISKVYGNAVMKSLVSNDTLYLRADTLINIENDTVPGKKRLLAFNHTKIFKSDLQGVCDSLAYNFADSTIYFYNDPVLWNEENQISADSINVLLVNNKINRMNLNVNSFIINQDTLLNFNQVKGRSMVAFFRDDDIYQVDVNGNGESIYFALENNQATTGMNKVACSNMIIRFENNKLKTISFLVKPSGNFMPPHEIKEPDKRLKGFTWRSKERPQLSDILGQRAIN